MKGLQSFIIKTDREYNEKIKLGSVEIYADKRFSQNRLVNHIAEVVEEPLLLETPIKKGDKVFLDMSVYLRYVSADYGEYENNYTIDKKKGIYKITEDLIYLYKRDNQWVGYKDNLFVREITKNKNDEIINGIIHLGMKNEKRRFVVEYINEELKQQGISVGDEVIVNEEMLLPLFYNQEKIFHLNNKDVYAKIEH